MPHSFNDIHVEDGSSLGRQADPTEEYSLDVLKFITHSPTHYESIIINSLNCDQSA